MENKELRILKNHALYVYGSWLCLLMIPISFSLLVYSFNQFLNKNLFFELYAYQKLVIAGFFCVFFTWLYLFKLRPLSFVKLALYKDGFKVFWFRRERYFTFDSVKTIERVGVNTNITFEDKTSFVFNHRLERAEYLIECLAKSNPKVFRKKDVRDYRDPLFHGSMKFARVRIFFSKARPFYFSYCLISLVVFFVLYFKQKNMFPTQGLEYAVDYFFRISLVISVLFIACMQVYIIYSQYQHKQRLKRNVLDKRRDAEWEGSFIDRVNWSSAIFACGLFATFYFYDLNSYNIHIMNQKNSKISFVIFDKRFKCLDCAFSIAPGIKVIDPEGRVGVVKGVAGDIIVRENFKLIRKPASQNSEVVGRDQVAVEIDGVIHYLHKDFIQGRLIYRK
jgi:hypothetical protein